MADTIRRIETTVLIIGAGAAGLRTAIELARRGVACLVIGKRRHGDAHTRWAAGGINACFGNLDPDDRWEIHAADTIREGHFICQPRAVELLAQRAPERVLELAEWGCAFDRTDEGKINQRYFGAQAYRRTCFVGDVTGEAVLKALVTKARELRIPHQDGIMVVHLFRQAGRVAGALGLDLQTGEWVCYSARAVVLAAGGCTSLYKRSSSREDENTGDALALAWRAGAALRDMEMIQFHPTGMIKPPAMRGRLVTEAVRGEGGRLFNARGERFMERYSPESMELDARDLVARANYEEIQQGRGTPDGGVLLDISHQDSELIRKRLPRIYRQFLDQGIDITREAMEVAPTAHYPMGGVRVNFETGETDVRGLYAVGECTSGLHGANRLGGNSLAETVVFGEITGAAIAERLSGSASGARAIDDEEIKEQLARTRSLGRRGGAHDPGELVDALRHLLWDHAGIVRTGAGLKEGLRGLSALREQARDLRAEPGSPQSWGWAVNLDFMIVTAEMILRAAQMRAESRGGHFRKDFPESRQEWTKNILCTRAAGEEMRFGTEPVPPVSEEIRRTLDEHHTLDHHLLE